MRYPRTCRTAYVAGLCSAFDAACSASEFCSRMGLTVASRKSGLTLHSSSDAHCYDGSGTLVARHRVACATDARLAVPRENGRREQQVSTAGGPSWLTRMSRLMRKWQRKFRYVAIAPLLGSVVSTNTCCLQAVSRWSCVRTAPACGVAGHRRGSVVACVQTCSSWCSVACATASCCPSAWPCGTEPVAVEMNGGSR